MLFNILMGIVLFLGVICVAVILAIVALEIRNAFLDYEEFDGTVDVTNKQYVSSYTTTTFISAGKVSVPQLHYHPEEFNVFVKWNDVEDIIDDEDLFNSVEIDDSFQARIHIGYNKARVPKNSYITLK